MIVTKSCASFRCVSLALLTLSLAACSTANAPAPIISVAEMDKDVETAAVNIESLTAVIEANPRASRTTPFIAKAYQIPYLNVATKVMLGTHKLTDFKFEKKLDGFAIKEPVFSFNKFPGVNKELGPEMKSTGEAIRFVKNLRDPYFRQLYKDRSMYLSK